LSQVEKTGSPLSRGRADQIALLRRLPIHARRQRGYFFAAKCGIT
jgi:hypothetical protein